MQIDDRWRPPGLVTYDFMPRPMPSAHLTTATHRAVECALHPAQGQGDADLQDIVRDLCAEARRQGTRAETLIVLFKKAWAERPELQIRSQAETSRLLDRVVTMCIEEYYDGAR